MEQHSIKVIAHIENDFTTKFGIPRQSGMLSEPTSRIVFQPEFRREEAFRDITGFSHLWIIWQFSEAVRDEWSPTVRPPMLGGNKRVGVFATRSPYRPNPLGLSCVKLLEFQPKTNKGPVLIVSGADLMNGTPIYDIKPYLPFADCLPEASGGFTEGLPERVLEVVFPNELLERVCHDKREQLIRLLSCDPRPSYQSDPDRVYGLAYANMDVRFKVCNGILEVCDVVI